MDKKPDSLGFDKTGCIIQCSNCRLIYQVDGTAGPDHWCIKLNNPKTVHCPNCGAPAIPTRGFGRFGWGLQNRKKRHGQVNKGKGHRYKELTQKKAPRGHAILRLMVLRLTGQLHDMDYYQIQAMEDVLTDKEIDKICTMLGHPRYCPSGKPIPPGECCKEKRVATYPTILPVSALNEGQTGKILLVSNQDHTRLEYLGRMGILPGTRVKVVSNGPAFVLKISNYDVAMDSKATRDVYVIVDS